MSGCVDQHRWKIQRTRSWLPTTIGSTGSKSVHFDMDPNSHFDMRRKGDKDLKISHLDFWNFMPKSSIHWLFLVSRVLKPLTSLMCFKGVNEFCGLFVSQNLRGYHQLTLPYFCAMKDVNLVIHLEKKRELWRSEKKYPSLFHKRHLKTQGGCGVFWRFQPHSNNRCYSGVVHRPHQPWGLWQYLKLCYSREVKFKTQPVLEAFPDKSTDTWR